MKVNQVGAYLIEKGVKTFLRFSGLTGLAVRGIWTGFSGSSYEIMINQMAYRHHHERHDPKNVAFFS